MLILLWIEIIYLDNRIFNETILGYSNNKLLLYIYLYNLKLTENNNKH